MLTEIFIYRDANLVSVRKLTKPDKDGNTYKLIQFNDLGETLEETNFGLEDDVEEF